MELLLALLFGAEAEAEVSGSDDEKVESQNSPDCCNSSIPNLSSKMSSLGSINLVVEEEEEGDDEREEEREAALDREREDDLEWEEVVYAAVDVVGVDLEGGSREDDEDDSSRGKA